MAMKANRCEMFMILTLRTRARASELEEIIGACRVRQLSAGQLRLMIGYELAVIHALASPMVVLTDAFGFRDI